MRNDYYPPTFVKRNAEFLRSSGTKFRMADNPGDVGMGPLYSYNVSMRNLLKANGIPVEFDSTAGNGHVADYTGPPGVAILKFHSDAFAVSPVVSLSRFAPSRRYGNVYRGLMAAGAGSAVPERWQEMSRETAIYSLSGRRLGRARNGGDVIGR